MRLAPHSSHLLLLALLSTIPHTQSDLQLAANSPEEFSLGFADKMPANEIIPPEDYANTDLLLSSNSGDDETKCSQHYNSPRRRMRVRRNDPSPLLCPFNPMNQYDFKQPPDAPDGGQQQIDNSEAGQQFRLDGSNNNNRPQPENDQKKGAWWQRIIPDWLDLGRFIPSPLKPNKKTEELYYRGSCSNGNHGPSVTVCAPADPPHAARIQVVIEWCRIRSKENPCVGQESSWCCKSVFKTTLKPGEENESKLISKRLSYPLTGENCAFMKANWRSTNQ